LFFFCEHKFSIIYCENNLAIFSVSNIGNKWKQKTRQNSPKFFTAKNVIINAVKKVIIKNTCPHENIKWKQMETKLAKTRHIFVNVELNIKQDQDYLNINKNKNVK
jgi:hypothetical protein